VPNNLLKEEMELRMIVDMMEHKLN